MIEAAGLVIVVVVVAHVCWLEWRIRRLGAKVEDLSDVQGIFERAYARRRLAVVGEQRRPVSWIGMIRRHPGVALLLAGILIALIPLVANAGTVPHYAWSAAPETSEAGSPNTPTTLAAIDSVRPRHEEIGPAGTTTTVPQRRRDRHVPFDEGMEPEPPTTTVTSAPPAVDQPDPSTTTTITVPVTTTTVQPEPTIDPDPEPEPPDSDTDLPPYGGGVTPVVVG